MDSNTLRKAAIVMMVFSVFVIGAFPSSAIVTAESFGVEDANGYKNTYVLVPVTITDVQGPILSIIFDITYDTNVINVFGAQRGTLTSSWDSPYINNAPWGTRVSIVYDAPHIDHAIQNGSTGSIVLLNFSVIGESGESSMMNLTNIQLAGPPPDYQLGTAPPKNGTFSILLPISVFDTGPGTYPSISGIFNGTLESNQTITVHRLYTYPCQGTGGHTEYVRIFNTSGTVAEAHWKGYIGDWHNLTFNNSFTLYENETYNYTICTGSYPQIIHKSSVNVTGGRITCTEFTDANGKRYFNWIPAITLLR